MYAITQVAAFFFRCIKLLVSMFIFAFCQGCSCLILRPTLASSDDILQYSLYMCTFKMSLKFPSAFL